MVFVTVPGTEIVLNKGYLLLVINNDNYLK